MKEIKFQFSFYISVTKIQCVPPRFSGLFHTFAKSLIGNL